MSLKGMRTTAIDDLSNIVTCYWCWYKELMFAICHCSLSRMLLLMRTKKNPLLQLMLSRLASTFLISFPI